MKKICNKCKVEKNLSTFHKDSSTIDGYRYICKICASSYRRDAKKMKNDKNSINSKICPSCGELKIFREYYKDKSHKDGISSSCKVCFNKHKRKTEAKYTISFQKNQLETLNGIKLCTKCKVEKLIVEFSNAKHSPTGKLSICKTCASEIQAIKRKKDLKIRHSVSMQNLSLNEYVSLVPKTVSQFYKAILGANKRAIAKGLEGTISMDDFLPLPDKCPLLHIPLFYTNDLITDNTPSIDRIDSSKGYTSENTWIISNKANRMKSNASIAELKLLVKNLNKKLKR